MKDLITYVMESQVSQTRIIDLTGGGVAEMEEAAALSQPNQNEARSSTSGISEVMLSQIAGPITRYVNPVFDRFSVLA